MATEDRTGGELLKEFRALNRAEPSPSSITGLNLRDRIRARLEFFVATMGIDLLFVIFMTALMIFAVTAMGGRIRLFQASIGLPLSIMAGLIVIKAIQSPKDAAKNIPIILRDWVPFLFIAFIYENLHDVAGRITHQDIAGIMQEWDIWLFGVEPTVWIQRFYSPLLTDYMAFTYALYFAFPLAIMFFLSLQNRRRAFRRMVLCLTFTFIIGFLCYVFAPCSPPRYFIHDFLTNPHHLKGVFIFNRLQNMWDGFSVIGGGAFPSLHVGISTVALIYAYKFRHMSRLYAFLYYLFIPLVVSLWISTVYLRHHWFIDILAGWMVAAISYVLAEISLKKWNKLRMQFSMPH